jgi:nanoRNase/pAp phosphatase (c-di-AMP/oligoRNAs hydrolase)
VKTETREAIERAAEAIAGARQIAIACHVSPDGDALGSSLALAHAAAAAGKQVAVSFGSPFALPDNLAFLDFGPVVPPEEFPTAPELMVVFDVASADRLGELAAAAERAGTLIVVDHHVSNDGFGDIRHRGRGSARLLPARAPGLADRGHGGHCAARRNRVRHRSLPVLLDRR